MACSHPYNISSSHAIREIAIFLTTVYQLLQVKIIILYLLQWYLYADGVYKLSSSLT